MLFKVTKEEAELFNTINFSYLEKPPTVEIGENKYRVNIADDMLLDVQIAMNDEISLSGMDDDREDVNKRGLDLYTLYDNLFYDLLFNDL